MELANVVQMEPNEQKKKVYYYSNIIKVIIEIK